LLANDETILVYYNQYYSDELFVDLKDSVAPNAKQWFSITFSDDYRYIVRNDGVISYC